MAATRWKWNVCRVDANAVVEIETDTPEDVEDVAARMLNELVPSNHGPSRIQGATRIGRVAVACDGADAYRIARELEARLAFRLAAGAGVP